MKINTEKAARIIGFGLLMAVSVYVTIQWVLTQGMKTFVASVIITLIAYALIWLFIDRDLIK